MKNALPRLSAIALSLTLCGCEFGQSPIEPDPDVPPLNIIKVVDAHQAIISLAFAPDGRLFYTEFKTGKIRIIKDDVLLPTPFATLPVLTDGEHGLLGITLHPDFENNGWVYVFYTHPGSAEFGEPANRVVRLTANGDVWDGTQTPIIDRLPQSIYHNGGNVDFGPTDGKLYVSFGEQFVEPATAQDLALPQGSVLRLNDDGTVPADNPIPGNPIFAYGLRNSFDFSFDPISKVLFATENGDNYDDEINRILAGRNYGWPMVEGMADTTDETKFAAAIVNYEDPILTMTPVVSPTGIAFAPNDLFGAGTTGDMFYGEWLAARIWRVRLNAARDAVASRVEFFSGIKGGIVDIEFSPDGVMYFSTMTDLWKIEPAPPEEEMNQKLADQ